MHRREFIRFSHSLYIFQGGYLLVFILVASFGLVWSGTCTVARCFRGGNSKEREKKNSRLMSRIAKSRVHICTWGWIFESAAGEQWRIPFYSVDIRLILVITHFVAFAVVKPPYPIAIALHISIY